LGAKTEKFNGVLSIVFSGKNVDYMVFIRLEIAGKSLI